MEYRYNYLDDLIQNLIVEIPFDKNNICRINWEDYFNHIFFQNNYKKEIFYLNNSLDKFNGTINMMISFINKKYEEFKNLIHKEIENINTDEHNEKIGNFSALLNEFSFNEDKNKLSEIFRIFEKSIFNDKVIVENKVYIDNDIIYEGETMKGTNIKNGKGVEYKIKKDNLLVFKGEYLNGKRNGKGREYYDNNNLKYQGEYKEGKIWNGKGYDIKGKLEFEVKNGNGKVKEYKSDGKLLFEGEYLKGERNGNGKEYNNNGELLFEGEYLNGKKNGKAKEYYYNGKLKFEGEYLNDKKNGKAKEYGNINDAELRFEGFYKEGEKWNGKSYWEFKRRKIRRGNSYFYIGNIIFEREYLNGKENLTVKEYYGNNNLKYEGEYKEGKIWNGKGYDINGKLEFEVKDGNGKGKEYQICSGNIIFEGEYLNGIRNGKGKEYYNDYDDLVLKFEGEYLNGKEWKGKEYYHHNDELKFENEYLNGKKMERKKIL